MYSRFICDAYVLLTAPFVPFVSFVALILYIALVLILLTCVPAWYTPASALVNEVTTMSREEKFEYVRLIG